MSQHSFVLVGHWSDVEDDSTFPLRPAGPNGSSGFCSLRWYAPVLGGTDSIGSGCASWGLLPSYLAM